MRDEIRLFSIPSVNRNNKYIELLLSALEGASSELKVMRIKNDKIINIFRNHENFKEGGKKIIHIHWSTTLYGSRYILKSFFLLAVNSVTLFILKTLFGFKIVWTIHNNFAHDYPHPYVDKLGRSILFGLSDAVTVHQKKILLMLQKRHPKKKIFHVSHGNYIDVYGPIVPRDYELRRSFDFEDDDVVLLSFGAVAPYKLNEKIIDALVSARRKNKKLKLLIAGKGRESYAESLKRHANDLGVVIQNKLIADSDLPRYLSVADYAVFYYDDSEMTSGAMVLALSYGVPVITRNIPAAEIVNGLNGQVFEDEYGLVRILQDIREPLSRVKQRDIIDDIRQYGWLDLAPKILKVYRSI